MLRRIVLGLIFFVLVSAANATPIKHIVILGDSLSDNGNLYRILKVIPKSPPYFEGRFSNGPTWAERLGAYFYNKSYIDTTNYALGGATSILHSPAYDSFLAPITITGEVYDYLLHSLFNEKSDTLYFVWIGANDYLYEMDPDYDTISTNVVNNISWTITTLISQGAKNFVIMNLPDLSLTPYAKDNDIVSRLHVVTMMHNSKLNDAVKQLKFTNPDAKILLVDIDSIFKNVIAHPEKYNQLYHKNLTNMTTACWTGGMLLKSKANQIALLGHELSASQTTLSGTPLKNSNMTNIAKWILANPALAEAYSVGKLHDQGFTPCDDAEQRMFWDHIHPTSEVHDLLASIIEPDLAMFNS